MKNKEVVSLLLVIGGAFIAALTIFFKYTGMGFTTTLFMAFAVPIAITCVITGTLLGFSHVLDRFAKPLIEEFHKDIEDDLEDIRQGRITTTQIMTFLTGIAGLGFLYLTIRYDKFSAMWGSVPVIIPTTILVLVGLFAVTKTDWFHDLKFRTPFWVYLIPLGGLVLSVFLGIGNTEDIRHLNPTDRTYQETGYDYYYVPRFLYLVDDVGSGVSSIDIGDIDWVE